MGWKELPRWLKYGLVVLIVFALISLVSMYFGLIGIIVPLNFIGLLIATFFGYNMMNSASIDGYFILMIIVSALFWFIVGALIGLAVQKMKSK